MIRWMPLNLEVNLDIIDPLNDEIQLHNNNLPLTRELHSHNFVSGA